MNQHSWNKKSKCLLLNSDYTPLSVVNWHKSIVWSIRYESEINFNIEILSYYNDQYILSANGTQYRIPSIARTIKYFHVYNRTINFSRKNLFIRDNYTCQYCGNIFNINQLTYDHVIPKSRYKSNFRKCTHWKNIVTSCIKCNTKKADKTPEEAGMKLINKPYEPKYSEKYLRWHQELIKIYNNDSFEEWDKYLQIK
ncbi:MAG: HNH endonuclease [Caulobacteraceae bacterium]|nr:HNH endonuclease [Caulobacteraceae bacterium]